ncbi:hypothetical protein SAMN02745866_04003 [Alteromonadaceae bacterium Bs31]|nr:hypothetical protein SAMN02745866_04003 [Alteromonadaceae bacterium Bs31]
MNKTECGHMGDGGQCICPKCDLRLAHKNGIPCQQEKCPQCGAKMLRKDSRHHQLLMQKRATLRD